MARTTTKKQATRSAPPARGAKAPAKSVSSGKKGTSSKVEWPVDGTKAAKKSETKIEMTTAAKTPESKPAAAKAMPVPKAKPAPKPAVAKAATPAKAPAPAKAPEPIAKTSSTPAPAVAPAATEAPKKGTMIMTDAMETAKTYAEEAKTRIQSAVAEMQDKAKVAMEKSAKAMEELGELTKGNFDAMVESSKIAAKGMEALSQEAVEFSRKSFEKSSSTFKSFASIKSPTEFFQLQSELMSSAMDSFASEAAKSSEAMLKLAGDVTQPISNRVAIVSEKVKALAA